MPNYSDPNDPTNPRSPNYKPRFIFEFHVWREKSPQLAKQPVKETPVKGNSQLVVPYIELDTPPIIIPFKPSLLRFANRVFTITGGTSISFKGQIKSQQSMLKVTFEGTKPKISLQFQADGSQALSNISSECDFDPSNLNKSSCTLTVNNSNSYTNTSINVSGGMPSIDVSSNDTGAGNSGVTLSPVSPTSITFHFDSEDLQTKSGNSTLKGHVHLEVNLSISPMNGDDASPSTAPTPSPALSKAEIEKLEQSFKDSIKAAGGYVTAAGAKISVVLSAIVTGTFLAINIAEIIAENVMGAVG